LGLLIHGLIFLVGCHWFIKLLPCFQTYCITAAVFRTILCCKQFSSKKIQNRIALTNNWAWHMLLDCMSTGRLPIPYTSSDAVVKFEHYLQLQEVIPALSRHDKAFVFLDSLTLILLTSLYSWRNTSIWPNKTLLCEIHFVVQYAGAETATGGKNPKE